MNFKNMIIVILLICIIGTMVFGSLSGFFGVTSSFFGGLAQDTNAVEGYTYHGGYIDSYQPSHTVRQSDMNNQETYDSSSQASDNSYSQSSSGNSYSQSSGSNDYSQPSQSSDESNKGIIETIFGDDDNSNNNNNKDNYQPAKNTTNSSSYEDWQKDYETDMFDEEGNIIYLSIVSTSGGEMEPGIYEVYWSSAGPINQTKIA